MNNSDDIYKQILAKYGIKIGLNIGESVGLISKTKRKKIGQRKRGCINENQVRLCHITDLPLLDVINCPKKYGSKECQKYRKSQEMKIKLFSSVEEVASKIGTKMIYK